MQARNDRFWTEIVCHEWSGALFLLTKGVKSNIANVIRLKYLNGFIGVRCLEVKIYISPEFADVMVSYATRLFHHMLTTHEDLDGS